MSEIEIILFNKDDYELSGEFYNRSNNNSTTTATFDSDQNIPNVQSNNSDNISDI